MKCVCGYEFYYKGSLENTEKYETIDEEFLKVEIAAIVKRRWEAERSVRIYACPACGTLQMRM